MRRELCIALVYLSAGCATYSELSPDERGALERDLSGPEADRFLKLSYFVTPFYGDASKVLVTPLPPDEVDLLDTPGGKPINPGPAQKIIPAGTRARILKVEFPTSWVVAGRIPYTPRTRPWVYLSVEGEPKGETLILVLRPQIKSHDEFMAEVERFLTRDDPQRQLAQWPESVRDAVKEKRVVADMPEHALEMAWGYPELKQISYDQQVRKEKWVYPGDRRVAFLADGRVTRTSP